MSTFTKGFTAYGSKGEEWSTQCPAYITPSLSLRLGYARFKSGAVTGAQRFLRLRQTPGVLNVLRCLADDALGVLHRLAVAGVEAVAVKGRPASQSIWPASCGRTGRRRPLCAGPWWCLATWAEAAPCVSGMRASVARLAAHHAFSAASRRSPAGKTLQRGAVHLPRVGEYATGFSFNGGHSLLSVWRYVSARRRAS